MRYVVMLLVLAGLGCAPVAASEASAEGAALLASSAAKLAKRCPGLAKYAPDLQRVGEEDNFSYAPPRAQRAGVVYQVADTPTAVPPEFRADGQRCTYDVSRDGKHLMIGKRACAMVCFDRTLIAAEENADPITLDL